MHNSERKDGVVKAKERDVTSIKVQADERLHKNVIRVDRWKGCVGEMLSWRKICKTTGKGLS